MKPIETLLLAIVIILIIVGIYYVMMNNKTPTPTPSSIWDGIKKYWPDLRGEVLSIVTDGYATPASITWINSNAPHGMTGDMTQADADIVCIKACDGWSTRPTVANFCDCISKKAINF